MTSVDFHARCKSYVRISIKDLNGKFGHELDRRQHPHQGKLANVCVAECELAAGHDGRCEMFVDGTGAVRGEPYLGYWLAWERRSMSDELQDRYEWITNADCCQAQSPAGWHCVRYANHPGGHAFTIED